MSSLVSLMSGSAASYYGLLSQMLGVLSAGFWAKVGDDRRTTDRDRRAIDMVRDKVGDKIGGATYC